MKKILIILAFIIGIFSSCNNEDIEISYSGGLTVSVSTQNAYDELGITQELKESWLSEGCAIGVYNFIYDKEGMLVKSDSVYTKTFEIVTSNFGQLSRGVYTVISLEMLVDPDDHYASPNWVIVGQDKMETIEVINKYATAYSYAALGLNSKEIGVEGGEEKSVTIVPKAIGAIINLEFVNFYNSPYKKVAFYTKDRPNGRFLSPNYTGNDRFQDEEYNPNRTWSSRGIKSDSEGLANWIETKVYIIEEGNIKYCFGPSKMKEDGTYENTFYSYPRSGEEFEIKDGLNYYGGLWYVGGTESDCCQQGLFDTKTQFTNWYNTILEATTKIVDPYLLWGTDANLVSNYMVENGMILSDSGSTENIYWTYYENKSGTITYEYQFDIKKSNLSVVFMNFFASSLNEVRNYIAQEYDGGEYEDELGGYYYYSTQTELLVTENTDSGIITVLFVPREIPNSSKKPSSDDGRLEDLIKGNEWTLLTCHPPF